MPLPSPMSLNYSGVASYPRRIRARVQPWRRCLVTGLECGPRLGGLRCADRDEPVGLAFAEFEGYLRIPSIQIYAAERKDAAHEHVKHVVRMADVVRAVVSIPDLVEMIRKLCDDKRGLKER